MNNPPKFDIKLTFTGQSLKGDRKNTENSLFLEKLINKKINIHLKINLDNLEHQYNKKKMLQQKYNIEDKSEEGIIVTDCLSLKEYSKENYKINPTIQLSNYQINLMRNNAYHKNSKSLSNQKIQNQINIQKNFLVLDLDETLVYVTDTKQNNLNLPQIQFEYFILDESEKYIKEKMKLGSQKLEKAISFLIIRPGFNQFINIVKKYFDKIVIFTSSQYSYAEQIIKIIDKQKIISKIYSRKNCSFYNDVFYKDLNKLNVDLSHTIIIDNSPESYLLQHFNGLPIPSFIGNSNDNELIKIIPLLEKLSKVDDVRNYIKQIIDFNNQINFDRAYKILNFQKNKISSFVEINSLNNYKKNNKKFSNNSSNKSKNLKMKKKIKINEKRKKIDNNEKILKNNPNDYFYIEKDNSQLKKQTRKYLRNNILSLSNNNDINNNNNNLINQKYFNKKNNNNKNLFRGNLCDNTLKTQIMNDITRTKTKKFISNNSNNKNIIELEDSFIKDVNINTQKYFKENKQNKTIFSDYNNNAFSTRNKIVNSRKVTKNHFSKKNTLNKKSNNIFSFTEKPKNINLETIPYNGQKRPHFSYISEIPKSNTIENQNIINLDSQKNDISYSTNYKNIPINNMKQLIISKDKKNSLSP